jgi:hypothetical protein
MRARTWSGYRDRNADVHSSRWAGRRKNGALSRRAQSASIELQSQARKSHRAVKKRGYSRAQGR